MADDDDFEPRLGRMRSGGGKRARRFLSRVIAATNLAAGGARLARSGKGFSGSRIGRGAGMGRMLASRLAGSRRVIVKTSIVRLAGKGLSASAAHLRYLQRDGTTRDGEPGTLYGRDTDTVDAKEFRQRGDGDRRQFRFIVSPEDGDQYDNLRPLTRRLMQRVEQDLGTKLDWVAVDHFNTGHPHTHIVVRGVDDRGKDLVIARDYLTRGIRERAAELVELDLGPPSQREIGDRLRREIGDERLTSIDRVLLRDARGGEVLVSHANAAEQTARAGRLAKLERMGLAEPLGGGRYALQDGIADTLRRMGERGDIIRTMQRAITDAGVTRAIADQQVFEPGRGGTAQVVGRLIARGLSDEASDRHFIIIDGIDGRAHYVDVGKGIETNFVGIDAIVSVAPRHAEVRAVDRTVVEIAAQSHGQYSIDQHLIVDPNASEEFARAHVRRLEALRRAGLAIERSVDGVWTIPVDHFGRVSRWEESQLANKPVTVEILSAKPLDRLVATDGATWLDRRLVDPSPQPERDAGFGGEVRRALEIRRQWLIEQGLAEESGSETRYSRGVLATLQRRELLRVADGMADEMGLPFTEAANGDRVSGIYRQKLDLVSGKFAVIERAHDFTLVPWRPALERAAGKSVSGIMREAGTSWSIGRGRAGPAIS